MNLSLSATGRAVISIAFALGAFALAPQVASGAVSCAYDAPNHIVNVGLNAADDLATLKRNADGTIAKRWLADTYKERIATADVIRDL